MTAWDDWHEEWTTPTAEPWVVLPNPEYDEVFDEAYPAAATVEREVYGAAGPPRLARQGYRVTSHERKQCACGSVNYSEQIGNRPPVLPERCWRCGETL